MTENRRTKYANYIAGYMGHLPEIDGPVPDLYFGVADEAIRVADKEHNELLEKIIDMIELEFPDPNPLSSLFTSYIGNDIIAKLELMKRKK